MELKNLILNTDSYKTSHFVQYPPGTEYVSSYIESRGGDYDESCFFGLQMFLKDYLTTPISQEDIDEAENIILAHGLPFNRAGWEHILNEHGGYLPLEISAVPEGSVVPNHNVLAQVVNTDPKVPWLTSYAETMLLRGVWYPTTVATISRHVKKVIKRYLDETADSSEGLPFKLHDFGARGVSSNESAAIGGLAHLVNFQGTDTVVSLVAARRYYGESMAGFSIPAAEHATMTAWGRTHEGDAYANMLEHYGGEGKMLAVVSDSYDIWNAIDNIWGKDLKEKVTNSGGTLVVRPDSGDPATVVCTAINKLMDAFGYSVNSKGYRILPDYVRIIQGDGVSPGSIEKILEIMKHQRLSADNVAFGMGSALLQRLNRDTLKFAMKASAARVNGEWRDVYKDPVTDPGKESKKGRLALVKKGSSFETIKADNLSGRENLLVPVFKDGELIVDQTLEEVRAKAAL